MGATDEMPSWATPLIVRRILWRDYGISIGLDEDSAYEDFLNMLRLNAAEIRRNAKQQPQQNLNLTRYE